MSIELATAYVTLIPSLRGAKGRIESELGGVETDSASRKIGRGLGDGIGRHLDTSAISSKLSSVSASLMGVGSGMTLGITTPVLAATGAMGRFAIETASAAETTEISFATMLGSAEAAEQMMGDLSDFAAKTPFELSGLQTATRQLLAYGFTAEDVIPMLTAVGDATSALGTGQQGIESVTRALGQMQTRGKVSAEEMLQLTEAGIPAWEYLARAIGTDTAGAMDAVSRGAVDAQTGIDALTTGMEQDFGGMMEQQSQTVAGLFSNLSDAIERPLMELRDTEAYDRFAEAVSGLVDSAGPFVESLLPHMEDGLDVVSDVLGKATDAMDGFAEMGFEGQESIIKTVAAAAGAGPALTVLGGGLKVASVAMGGIGKAAGAAKSAFKKLADAADTIHPATEKASNGIKALNGVCKATAIGLVVGLVADLVGQFTAAQQKASLMADATMDASDIVAEASGKLSDAKVDVDGYAQSLADLNRDASETLGELGTQSAMLDGYIGTIERLAGQADLTTTEQAELTAAVDGYNGITGYTVGIVDAANGKLSESTDEIRDNADAWRDNAKAQALQEYAADYYAQMIEGAQDLADAEAKLADADEGWGIWLGDFPIIADEASVKYHELQGDVEDLTELQDANAESYETMASAAEIAMADIDSSIKDVVQSLPLDMQGFGLNVAGGLTAGIQAGNIDVSMASQFMTGIVSGIVAQLPPSLQLSGAAAAQSLASGVSSGELTVSEATQILNAVVSGTVDQLPAELRPAGFEAASAFGMGLGNASDDVATSASEIAAAAEGMDDVGDMEASGYHLGQNFANGLSLSKSLVSNAASKIASTTLAVLGFSVPKEGPWSGSEKGGFTSGLHLGQNFARGMMAGSSYVAEAADKMALAAIPGTGAGGFSSGQMSRTDAILVELLDSLPRMIRDNSPSSMTVNGREFARAVREVVPA